MIFSEWLKEQLKSRRLTGAELAERVDISRASIYFYLDGSRIPGQRFEDSLSWRWRHPSASH